MNHYGKESPRDTQWQTRASLAARKLLRRARFQRPFVAEVLTLALVEEIGEPADRRSVGWVIRNLADSGRIRRVGIGRATVLRHGALGPAWVAA